MGRVKNFLRSMRRVSNFIEPNGPPSWSPGRPVRILLNVGAPVGWGGGGGGTASGGETHSTGLPISMDLKRRRSAQRCSLAQHRGGAAAAVR